MDPNVKLLPIQGESLSNFDKYRRLVEKFNYLKTIHSNISFEVSFGSKFLNSPYIDH